MMGDARDRNQGVWIEHDDRVYVSACCSTSGVVVQVSGYFRKMNGEIIEYAITLAPPSDRSRISTNQFFGAGFLLSCTATMTSGTAMRGQCYVRVQIQRSTSTPLVKLQGVLGGYVTNDHVLSFPYGKIEGPLEGPGYTRYSTISNPAAGANVSTNVPTGARWRILAVGGTYAASGSAGNRTINVFVNSGVQYIAVAGATTAHTAGQTKVYHAGVGQVDGLNFAALVYRLALTENLATQGTEIQLLANGILAGDQWSDCHVIAEEWIEE